MNQKLKEKILESLSSVLPITAIVLVLSVLLVPIPIGTFLLFLAGLAALTVIPQNGGWTGLGWDRVNLVPFRVFRESAVLWRRTGSPEYFVINVIGNIAIFLPLGFFPCLLWEDRGRGLLRGTGWALFASLCVELCQLPQDRGTDVDDLWLNALGGALGFLLYLLVRRLWPRGVGRCRVRERR